MSQVHPLARTTPRTRAEIHAGRWGLIDRYDDFDNSLNFLWMLQDEAEKVLEADTWRVWELDVNDRPNGASL